MGAETQEIRRYLVRANPHERISFFRHCGDLAAAAARHDRAQILSERVRCVFLFSMPIQSLAASARGCIARSSQLCDLAATRSMTAISTQNISIRC
jgi:hypothetical protein